MSNNNGIIASQSLSFPDELQQPRPMFAAARTDTSNFIWWNGSVGATTYELQRDTDPAFPSPTALQNTAAREYLDTGLTVNTTYHYRVRAIGTVNSSWREVSQKTIGFTPTFWYEPTGVGFNQNNEFADTSVSGGFLVSTAKSLFATGLNATVPTARGVSVTNVVTPVAKQTNFGAFSFSSPLSFTGDFHVCVAGIIATVVPLNRLFGRTTANGEIRFNSSDNTNIDSILLADFGPGPNISISISASNQLVAGRYYRIELKRVSGTLSYRINGNTFDVGTGTNTDTIAFDDPGEMFDTIERFVCVPQELSDAQASEVFNYIKSPSYTVGSATTAMNVNVPNAITNNVVELANLDNKGTGSFIRDRALMLNNDIAAVLLNDDEPNNWQDYVLYFDVNNDTVSNRVNLGVTEPFAGRTAHDYHNSGSIANFDNQLIHWESVSHYDGSLANSFEIVLKRSGYNFDLSNFHRTDLANDVPKIFINRSQYHQSVRFNNTHYLFHQEDRFRSVLHRFNDGIVCPDRIVLFDGGNDATLWMYKHVVYSEDGTLRVFLLNYDVSITQDKYVFYVKSTDGGNTWTNGAGTFSKELFDSQDSFTLSELITNCLVFDVSSTTGDVALTGSWFDGTTIHAVALGEDTSSPNPGTNQFNTYLTINDSTGAISKFEIDTGTRSVFTDSGSDGYPIIWLDADNHVHVACFELNMGIWIWVEFESTDGGTTWSYVQDLSNDNTFKFQRPFITRNAAFVTGSRALIGCIREDQADTAGDVFNGNGDLLVRVIDV